MEFIGDLDGEMCAYRCTLSYEINSGWSVPVNLFGDEDDDENNFKTYAAY